MKNHKAYFYSLDALIALIVILGVVLVIKPSVIIKAPQMNLQEDLLNVLSSLKVGEIDNPYVQNLVSTGEIVDLNQSVLEQIGEFYAVGDIKAELMTNAVLSQLEPENNLGVYFSGIPIYENGIPISDARDIWTARQIISGIQAGESVRGYSSRAFLSASNKVDYFYFGGYVGDGNITVKFNDKITGAKIEGVFSGEFDLYINEQFVGHYIPSASVPYKIDLSSHLSKFNSGINYIDFKSNGNLYIAGGFIRTSHEQSAEFISSTKKYFPGIKGLINIYDSFYVPSTLNTIDIFLHLRSQHDLFLTIGNQIVFQGNTGGVDSIISLSNSQLAGLLDYSQLEGKTIPLRLGLFNATYLINQTIASDVFSVTDLSGSMDECALNCSINPIKLIDLARDANRAFIEIILNYSDNRAGLVGYESLAKEEDYHGLSTDISSLNQEIDSWKPGGGTCICCGVNKAAEKIQAESDATKFKAMVVMSDGRANVKCPEQATGSATEDAIQAACNAYDNYGVRVYTVGFGDQVDEPTMQAMASCSNGNYYYSSVEELVDIYRKIAGDIINASYVEQTVVAQGIDSQLFPDSYIQLNFDRQISYGLIISAETPEFGNEISEGKLEVPDNVEVYDLGIISYSGSKWTDRASIYNDVLGVWDEFYNLEDYGLAYTSLGDPYIVNVPPEKVAKGNNTLKISTGLSPANFSGGSRYNKIVYTFIKDISSYSTIVASAKGCIWHIEFEGGGIESISVPQDYAGSEECYYTFDNLAYKSNDAIDIAVYRLLQSLDLNLNRKVETKFSEQDLALSTNEIQGIPFTWDTEVQARVWR
ncbi:VWA domain-containing protein [Candidatus Pacearchaeota archaeon]|nr:VWA domain-containing protein [Candidatus Pacearchaeota archaeon]